MKKKTFFIISFFLFFFIIPSVNFASAACACVGNWDNSYCPSGGQELCTDARDTVTGTACNPLWQACSQPVAEVSTCTSSCDGRIINEGTGEETRLIYDSQCSGGAQSCTGPILDANGNATGCNTCVSQTVYRCTSAGSGCFADLVCGANDASCTTDSGTCQFYCQAPTPTPIPPTPIPGGGSCTEMYGNQPYIACGDCHYYAANGGSCTFDQDGCCLGSPGSGPTDVPTVTPAPVCDTVSFSCSGFSAFNLTDNTPAQNARGKAIGSNPYDDTFTDTGTTGGNTVYADPGDVVQFSTFKGGPGDPIASAIMTVSSKPHTRTQFISRDRSIPNAGQSADVIGSCLMISAPFRVNWCENGDSKIGWDNRNNSDWPWGYWPYSQLPVPPDFGTNYQYPDVVPAKTFSETRVESGITRVFSGTCGIHDQKQTCCAISRTNPGSAPGVPETYTCTNTGEGDACNSRAFWPMSCRAYDAGYYDVPGNLARSKTMRKQFSTAGEYTVEATEQVAIGCTVNNNDQNPCAIKVVVRSANATITGRLINDNNANAATDPDDTAYTGTASITISPNPGGTITTAWNAATGTYTLGNVPTNATYTITITGLSVNRYFSSNQVSDSTAQIAISVPNGATSLNANPTYVSRFYTISGYIFNDLNKNDRRDAGEDVYTGGAGRVTDGALTVNVQADGTYTLINQKPNRNRQRTVRYSNSSLTSGFIISWGTWPGIEVGTANSPTYPTACTGITAPATCTAASWPGIIGDVENLNFAVTNSRPWVLYTGLDVRIDSGFSNSIPETVAATCTDPVGTTTNTNRGYSSVGR